MASVSNSGLAGAVKLVVKTFLEAEHYQDLHRFLCEHWSDMHSLTAAMRLMEAHGVHISEQAQKKYKDLPEDRVIDTLVMLMPQQSREQFEHFFLQLSLIASTTTRLRAALESGNEHQVEEVLDSAENVGVLQFILRMAVAQAGQEVKQHTEDHNNWLAACADRMNPLLQSQANAMISQKALVEAKAQLGFHRVEANEKSKKVLMGLAGGNETALKTFVFATWADEVQNTKKENEIRKEYQEEIDIAEKRLQDYILSQTSIMKNMINKKHGNSIQELLHTCFDAFVAEIQVKKDKEAQDLEMAELNAKMATFSKEQAAKSKKVLSRMNAGSDAGLLEMCLQAWIQFIADYNKNREFEDAVKKEEAKLAEFMKKQNAGASAVLNRMSQATDTGLVQQCFQGWVDVFTEQKKANELQDFLISGSVGNQVTDASVVEIAKMCPAMTVLNLDENTRVTDTSVVEIAKCCHAMTELYLGSTQVTDAGVKEMARGCPAMTKLRLGSTRVTDTSVVEIARHCPHMTMLDLTRNQVTDASVMEIARHCPAMTMLCLGSTRVTDTSVVKIAEGCPAMAELYLDSTRVTDTSVVRIAKGCPRLRVLGVINTAVTQTMLQEIDEVYPGIVIDEFFL